MGPEHSTVARNSSEMDVFLDCLYVPLLSGQVNFITLVKWLQKSRDEWSFHKRCEWVVHLAGITTCLHEWTSFPSLAGSNPAFWKCLPGTVYLSGCGFQSASFFSVLAWTAFLGRVKVNEPPVRKAHTPKEDELPSAPISIGWLITWPLRCQDKGILFRICGQIAFPRAVLQYGTSVCLEGEIRPATPNILNSSIPSKCFVWFFPLCWDFTGVSRSQCIDWVCQWSRAFLIKLRETAHQPQLCTLRTETLFRASVYTKWHVSLEENRQFRLENI